MDMNTIFQTRTAAAPLWSVVVLLLLVGLTGTQAARAQATPADTIISNTATATYTDGQPGSPTYNATSPPVTVTVARVAGLAITPDNGSVANVVPGQTNVDFTFTVTNSSNYATNVQFLASRASIVLGGSATVAMAVVDGNGDGQIDSNSDGAVDAGDVDIKNNAANVSYGPVARNASFLVIVRVNVNAAAAAGSNISVTLGDAPVNGTPGDTTHDNVKPADNSAAEVRTITSGVAPVGGEAEARGNASTTVENDTQLRLAINAPAGPIARGSDITYTWTLDNTGLRAANTITLPGVAGAAGTGVFVMAPIPAKTVFKNVGTLPGGVTVLYSTVAGLPDPLTAAAAWSTTAPADPTTVKRVAYNIGNTLAAGASFANLQTVVTVSATADTTTPVFEIGDAFAKNRVNATITDQSGDVVVNKGDGNADYNEPKIYPAPTPPDPASATQGYQVPTTLLQVGLVFIGPSGVPQGVGPTNNNDDFTNLSTSTGINVAPGGNTNAVGTVTFTNTVQNAGNANDTFTLSAPTVPAGFTVEISTNGGTSYTTVSGGGSTTLAVAFGASANILVRVTAPAGNVVLTGFNNVIRAASGITPAATNDTIDRVYTGFLQLDKTVRVLDALGAVAQPIPGNFIEYTIAYKNVASANVAGNPNLTANNVVITENGSAGTNNWASFTDYVLNSALDPGGTIGGNAAGSTVLTDTIVSVAPQGAGTFKFTVKIR
jgi:hypothetical protein